MSVEFALDATARSELGKGASRRLRRENKVPGIIYGGGKDPQSVTFPHNDVVKVLENEAFYSHIIDINLDGKTETAVLKDLQRHPYKPIIVHMDFLRVSAKDSIRMQVPLHFINEDIAPGVKLQGGQVVHNYNDIEVVCEARNLPEYIEVDVGALSLGDSIQLSDIKLPKGVEIPELNLGEGHDQPVASIRVAVSNVEEDDVVDAEESAAAPEADDED
jgi:large subunit ribosomal protein L25